MKKTLVIVLSIIAVISIALGVGILVKNAKHENSEVFGVSRIYVKKTIWGEAKLMIDYFGIYGYSITPMDKTEPLIKGEKEVVVEELGENRVAVRLGDAEIAESLMEQYPSGQVHVLEDVPSDFEGKIRVWLAYADPHTVMVYIGTDESIAFESREFQKSERGKVEIKL